MTDQDAPARRRLPARCWQDMTSSEMTGGDAGNWIVVLPVAATEQHGPHLPLGTDSMIFDETGAAFLYVAARTSEADIIGRVTHIDVLRHYVGALVAHEREAND